MIHKLLFCCLLFAVSCGGNPSGTKEWMEDNQRIKVVSTTAMIHQLVTAIGGGHIASIALIGEGLDPHSYQLVKGDGEKLSRADLIFFNGLGLEHGASLHYYLENSPKAVSLGGAIYKENPELILHVNNQFDPHIWMDVSLFSKTVPIIVAALSKKDPAHASDYERSGRELDEALKLLHEKVRALIRKIPEERRYLVTSHDAFNYFTRAYLMAPGEALSALSQRFQAPEGLAPDSQISSSDIQGIIDHVKRYGVTVIFPESNVSQDSIRKIVDAAKQENILLRISKTSLYGDSMGKPGSDGDTYEKMLLHNAKVLYENLTPDETK